jgi:hypothetical protein
MAKYGKLGDVNPVVTPLGIPLVQLQQAAEDLGDENPGDRRRRDGIDDPGA